MPASPCFRQTDFTSKTPSWIDPGKVIGFSPFAHDQGSVCKPPGIMKKFAKLHEKPLVSTGIFLEKICQTRCDHLDFLSPVITVNISNLSVNHVMGRDTDLDVLKAQIKEIGIKFAAGISIEIIDVF